METPAWGGTTVDTRGSARSTLVALATAARAAGSVAIGPWWSTMTTWRPVAPRPAKSFSMTARAATDWLFDACQPAPASAFSTWMAKNPKTTSTRSQATSTRRKWVAAQAPSRANGLGRSGWPLSPEAWGYVPFSTGVLSGPTAVRGPRSMSIPRVGVMWGVLRSKRCPLAGVAYPPGYRGGYTRRYQIPRGVSIPNRHWSPHTDSVPGRCPPTPHTATGRVRVDPGIVRPPREPGRCRGSGPPATSGAMAFESRPLATTVRSGPDPRDRSAHGRPRSPTAAPTDVGRPTEW